MRTALLALLLTPLALIGCDASEPATVDVAQTDLSAADPSIRQAFSSARRSTAPYHRVARAEAAGWTQASPCVASPAGGMGYHYVNGALMDGALDPAAPEALLYEPQPDGSVTLVGVEYVVPFAAAPPDGPAPELFGQAFQANPFTGSWALHVWIWRHNPSGMFADFNPTVSCAYAE